MTKEMMNPPKMEPEEDAVPLVHNYNGGESEEKTPQDSYNAGYIIYFILGTGCLIPYHAFMTAVDYFQHLYPDRSIDRTFSMVFEIGMLLFLIVIIFCFRKSHAFVRINVGLALFLVALLVVPFIDLFYIKGQIGLYRGFYVTVCAAGLAGFGDALVQSGLIGSAGELPERYVQAVVSGQSASGIIVSSLRIFTKASYPHDFTGLRNSAILYFTVAILLLVICIILYNVAYKLPIMKHYNALISDAVNEEKHSEGTLSGPVWQILQKIKWHGIALVLLYIVTLSIYPGFITEDVHSESLGDWYGILLIAVFDVSDFIGRSLPIFYLIESANVAVCASFARLLFYPLFLGCLHGPQFFRTEIPVTVLTCLLGLTSGYFTSVVMILAPKTVKLQHSETAGILMVLFLAVGLAAGSILTWFWVV